MKVSEAIDQLEIGDTVWVRSEVNYINKAEMFPICCDLAETSIWICGVDEISLSEPNSISDEKVLELVSTSFRFDKENFWNQLKEMDMLPQAENVEVPDWFDQWYKAVKNDSVYPKETALKLINQCGWGHMLEYQSGENVPDSNMTVWINENRLLANRAILDGYTVKPKRWVVKSEKHIALESFLSGTVTPMWTTEEPLWMTFTDKSKAEAVAVLVEGSVEEV